MDVMELLTSTLIQGLIYALISYGVYITYSILDFPDLGVDGTFPLGAAVTAVLMTKGVNAWLTLPISLVLVIVVKLLLDAYFHTKSGLLLRAVGDNATLVTTLAKDRGTVKILGLVISNALVAFGGCIVCHETRSFSATMGTGQLVYGLAAVIIGVSLMHFYTGTRLARGLRKSRALRFLGSPQGTTAVVLGSVLYKLCIQVAMSMGLPTNMMKLITAALFLLVLVLSGRKGEAIIHA